MAIERTLCIVKPDAVAAGHQGAILQAILEDGFKIQALRQSHLGRNTAASFYAVHAERPFFDELVEFMISGPVVVASLERDDAVMRYRTLIGATDPAQAKPGTLRARYGSSLGHNAVHGSDSPANGERETAFFFSGIELGLRLD